MNDKYIDKTQIDDSTFINMYRFEKKAEKLLLNISNKHSYTMVVFDIDKFSEINQNHGYLVGDDLLVYINSILNFYVQEPNLYCRLYDDHFALFLENYKNIDIAILIIQISEEFYSFNPDIKKKLSFGICRADSSKPDIMTLCNCAIYAKRTIKGQACQFLANYNEVVV